MLRYHMAVITGDNALRRAVKRLTTATGSTADFGPDASILTGERPVNLAIFDARDRNPDHDFLQRAPREAQMLYIVQGDRLVDKLSLLKDRRAVSLFCHDERFDDDEFVCTATKALRGEVFGLQKYFPWGVTTFSVAVKNHEEKGKALDILLAYANLAGVRGAVRDRIQLVCDELMMNALYHAPVDEKGNEKFAGKTLKELAQLPEVNPIRVQYGCSGRYFGVSVRDSGGSLARARCLEYLLRARDGAQIEDRTNGAGLGLISVLRSVSKLVFNLDPGHSTEVIAIFDMELFAKGKMGARSLHMFTAPPHEDEEDEDETAAAAAAFIAPRRGAWALAAVLLAVLAGLGTAVVMKSTGAASASAEPAEERTVTVFPEPFDSVLMLDGVPIDPRKPVKLAPGKPGELRVGRAGHQTRTINLAEFPSRGDRILYVTLAPLPAPE